MLGLAVRRHDLAPVVHLGGTGDGHIRSPRDRVDGKADMRGAGGAEGFDVKGMQRRCARPGIDLGLQRGQAEIGQRHPFLPPQPQRRATCIGHVAHQKSPVRLRPLMPLNADACVTATGDAAAGRDPASGCLKASGDRLFTLSPGTARFS